KNLTAPRMSAGSQHMVLWKNDQMAANHTRHAPGAPFKLKLAKLAATPAAAQALTVPDEDDAKKTYEATFSRFCGVFPDTFYVTERDRPYLSFAKERKQSGRLLNAGFHSMTGYYRDDRPLYDLILSGDEQRELDRLWLDFDAISGAPMRQYTAYIWYERAETGFLRGVKAFEAVRAEDKDSTSERKMKQFEDILLGQARATGASEAVLKAIMDHFKNMGTALRRTENARRDAEPKHLASLQSFAERAYRRPLSKAESEGLVAF